MICPKCDNKMKLLFNSFYCDCELQMEKVMWVKEPLDAQKDQVFDPSLDNVARTPTKKLYMDGGTISYIDDGSASMFVPESPINKMYIIVNGKKISF